MYPALSGEGRHRNDSGGLRTIYPNDALVKNGDHVSMEARFSGVLEVR
jgi:hypothetical protein